MLRGHKYKNVRLNQISDRLDALTMILYNQGYAGITLAGFKFMPDKNRTYEVREFIKLSDEAIKLLNEEKKNENG